MIKKVSLFVICLFLCFLPMAGGLAMTSESLNVWYAALSKPFLTAPAGVFFPVWVILYTLTAVILYKLIRAKISDADKKCLIYIFAAIAVLNLLWTPAFFACRALFLALCIITLMAALSFTFIRKTWRIKRILAYLMMPYFFWLVYAFYLNAGVWFLN